ncbi:ABC transporter substrate-binding protein [Yersinia pseudotuberculosis]|uniref:ABC transporter substrate-binding protein n=1 Tax=Yersinia pseudotuberculosis TaxID=633 RepID=UPI001F37B600|nr:ABC transporter substrate-binding protein [Yersinia pseudotuberculosis]MCF1164550.1 ABC transporter substrate-binding protein [Yersinia pseudotuberculosis]
MRLLLLIFLLCTWAVSAKTITDITGQRIEIPDNPQRIVLGESRMLYTLALLEPGYPAARVVGWPLDLKKYDPQSWALYTDKFPQMTHIPALGSTGLRDINPEKVLELAPDLVILPVLAKTTHEEIALISLLKQAHIPVIRVDLRVDLLNHTIPSLRLLGEALNRQDRAEAFISLYQSHMDRIHQRIAAYQGPHPSVLLQLHLGRGDECCTTTLKGNLGQLLEFAGGNNIAAAQVKGVFGQLSEEYVLARSPEIYIATGMATAGSQAKTLALGPQVSTAQAQESFRRVIATQSKLQHLPAIQNGHAWGLWHNFYLSPLHVVAAEVFAKTLYPHLFADVSPQDTLQTIYQQFLPLDFTGTFWSHLDNE